MAWRSPEVDTPRYIPNIITLNSLPHEWRKNKLLMKTEQVRSCILRMILKYKQQTQTGKETHSGKFIALYITVFLSCVEPCFCHEVVPKVCQPLKITSVRSVESSGCISRLRNCKQCRYVSGMIRCRQSVLLHFGND